MGRGRCGCGFGVTAWRGLDRELWPWDRGALRVWWEPRLAHPGLLGLMEWAWSELEEALLLGVRPVLDPLNLSLQERD